MENPMTKRHGLIGVGLAAAALASSPALAQPYDRDWMWGGGPFGWGGMMIGGGLTMIIFWGGIILLVVLLARWLGGGSRQSESHPPRQTALEILQERYARGEIDKAEYEERRKTLTG
jgi:putative membrane protein